MDSITGALLMPGNRRMPCRDPQGARRTGLAGPDHDVPGTRAAGGRL